MPKQCETFKRRGARIPVRALLALLLLPSSSPQWRVPPLLTHRALQTLPSPGRLQSGSAIQRKNGGATPARTPTAPQSDSSRVQAEDLRVQALALIRKATRSDLSKAAMKLRASTTLFIGAHLSEAAAADYLSLGEIYLTRSQFQNALRVYQLALMLSKDPGSQSRCPALSRIAVTYVTIGNLEQAKEYSGQAMDCSSHTSNPQIRAQALEAQGLALMYAQDTTRALNLFRTATDLLRDTQEIDTLASASLNEGIAYLQLGEPENALKEENAALRLWQSSGNIHGVARAQGALGLLWALTGEPDKAGASYKNALRTFRSIGDLDNEAITLNVLGVLNEEIGNYEDSFRNFSEARKIFDQLGDSIGQLAAIDGAAKAQWKMGHYTQAQRLYENKLKLAQKSGAYRMEASSWSNLADAYALTHQPEKAEHLYLRALAFCRSAHYPLGEVDALIHLGHFYSEQGAYDKALNSLQEAIQPAEKTERVAKLAQIHFEIAAVYRLMSDLNNARLEIEKTIQFIESQRLKVPDFESRTAYFASVHSYYQLYIGILMDLHRTYPDADYARQAFEASEKSKVRSLLDMLAGATTAGCGAAPDTKESVAPAAADAASVNCAVHAPSVLTLSQVQAEIHGDDTILLEYALGRQHGYLWAVDEAGMSVFDLPGTQQIEPLTAQLLKSLTARQRTQGLQAMQVSRMVHRADQLYPRYSAELAKILLGPVAHLLVRKRVVIVPDGPLQYVPFSVLPFPVEAGHQNATTPALSFDLVSLPSASTLKAIRNSAATHAHPTWHAAIFADPVFGRDDPRFRTHGVRGRRDSEASITLHSALRDVGLGSRIQRLPESRTEAHWIASSMSGERVLLALGFDANREAVLKGDLGKYRYIHFATHGLLDATHPESSGLVLSLVNEKGKPQDGYLRLADIYQLKLSANLVVLSSCESALGKDLSSEGIISLTRAFLSAGSRGVVSTLWKVDDAATSELMKRFYERLRAGDSPAAALRRAQSDLRAIPQWKSPYYWAAFVLQGDYR
ncbi:MAG: CHAT domain-containing protein [Acidobacteriia bacterium]|nr:CHAT domain-containing protein [Terriglobia bacterium]